MDTEINAMFHKLPEGFSYKLKKNIPYGDKYAKYGVVLITPGGKEVPLVGKNDQPIGFTSCPGILYAVGDVRDTLVKNEIGDGEAYYYHVHGYGERTGNYLQACKEIIGLIDYSCDENLSPDLRGYAKFDKEDFDTGDIYLRSDCNNKTPTFTAMFQVGPDIGTFYVYRYVFNRYPSMDSIMDAHLVHVIEMDFSQGEYTEDYICCECGRKISHWLDVEGGLGEKREKLKEKYCGC